MSNRNTFTQADIDSFHWLKFDGQHGEVLYALSGIIKVNMTGSSSNWVIMPITCTIDIPVLPAGMGFLIKYHTPSASLNSIYNKGQAINGGHAVNNCRLNFPNGHVSSNQTQIALELAVSDTDAVLYKVGFNIVMSGFVTALPPADPCKAEADHLNALERMCNGGYESLIQVLQAQLATASPAQKPAIIREIRENQEKLNACPVDLSNARNALNRCRLTNTENPTH